MFIHTRRFTRTATAGDYELANENTLIADIDDDVSK
jgi:hypothetical protein